MWRKIGVLRKVLRFLFCFLLVAIYRAKEKNKTNILVLKEHLKQGSIIFVLNHICLEDVPIFLSLLYFKMGREISCITIPASLKNWKSFLLGRLMRLSRLFGVELFPVVQHYERDIYPLSKIMKLDKKFLRAAKKTLLQKGGIVLITPEGHRGYGKIQHFQSGIKTLAKVAKKNNCHTLIAPIGIEVGKNFGRNMNLGKQFILHFGEPILAKTICQKSENSEIPINELIKEKIIKILPPEYSSLK